VRTFSGAREEKLSSFCLCTSMCADSAILVLFFSYLRTRQSVSSEQGKLPHTSAVRKTPKKTAESTKN